MQAPVDEEDEANIGTNVPEQVHPLVSWFNMEAGPTTIIYEWQGERRGTSSPASGRNGSK